MRCMFDYESVCAVLTVRQCEGCKFAKSESEYVNAQARSDAILRMKGLQRVVIGKGANAIMSTEKICKEVCEVVDNG